MKRKITSILLLIAMILTLIVGSLAYFTDRATTDATATAGTVAINLDDEIDFDNISEAYASTNSVDFFSPADIRTVKYTVKNVGNKSIDVKETLVLSVYDKNGDPLNVSDTVQSELDIFDIEDIEGTEENGFFAIEGKTPITVKTVADNVITYNREVYTLNGNEEFGDMFREIEDDITTDKRLSDMCLLFYHETGNDFQECVVKLDLIVEAKQHRNTSAIEWAELQTETVVLSNGASQDVVDKVIDN